MSSLTEWLFSKRQRINGDKDAEYREFSHTIDSDVK
jgi:hypothetical protein